MTPQLWIGFGFLAALVVFLIVSFFVTPKLTPDQRRTIKFLTSLCAGVSGGFLTGASVFDASWTGPAGKIAISGTAGFALFLVVWFFYDKTFSPDDVLEFDIPSGATFRQALDAAAALGNATLDYQKLNKSELMAAMTPGHVSSNTLTDLLVALRLKTRDVGAVREYSVSRTGNIYQLVF